MRFYEPIYLLGIALIPIIGLFFWWSIENRKKILARFGDLPLVMRAAAGLSFKRKTTKILLLLIAILFLSVAAAKPQLGTHMEMVKREGIDIVIALDLSKSMEARDVVPGPISRLDKAKQQIRRIIDPSWLQGDRIGLVGFAGEAFVHCPLTVDYSAARLFLDALDPDIISVPGTALGNAIQAATEAFNRQERKHKVVILLTDGEDHGTNPIEAAEAARKEGVKIYTIGIGNPEGEPIPIYNQRGERVGFKKDEDGEIIVSKLDQRTLQKIALNTGGKYYRASPSELELEKIYGEISSMEKKELEGRLTLQYDDRFQWPLSLALLFIVWEVFIPERIRKNIPRIRR